MSYSMDHKEFRAIRQGFGFTLNQMGDLLGLTVNQVSRLERDPKLKSARPIDTQLAQLMDAYRQGYRPPHWPRTGEGSEVAEARTGEGSEVAETRVES